jgi:electron transport complex protein RnfD
MVRTGMAEQAGKPVADAPEAPASTALQVAPGPHLSDRRQTTRRMMLDVLIAMVPLAAVSLWIFRWYAARQLAICIASCVAAETLLTLARRRAVPIGDLSAVVTGAVLAFSLPGPAPWYVGVVGGFAAIGLGKVIFGGLGQNLFNPAMVGRAFVMITFTAALAAGGYAFSRPEGADPDAAVYTNADLGVVDALTRATPMTEWHVNRKVTPLWRLVRGDTNGSLGETSAIACLLGGLYLLVRRTAAWRIPAGMLAAATVCSLLATRAASVELLSLAVTGRFAEAGRLLAAQWTVLHDLAGGALLFGAFFIATDPVSSPLTPRGRWAFGIGAGALVMLIRTFSRYPEGVMFSVLLMNAVSPLINRWTIPRPVGGPAPAPGGKA